MIVLVALLAILLLISCVCGYHFYMQLGLSKREITELNAEIAELEKPKQEAPETDEVETGQFVRRQHYRKATAETYRNVFDLDINGQRVLEDLTARFGKPSYVRGGHDAERESCFRAGQYSFLNFILAQISRANDPNNEELNDD